MENVCGHQDKPTLLEQAVRVISRWKHSNETVEYTLTDSKSFAIHPDATAFAIRVSRVS